ncbi:MAG: hypothetical protein LWY06_09175 [Firmicutes bacterium]|nr:hypothetical protein [Bacillota bacterium]
MDLLIPVKLKNNPMDFNEYIKTINTEQTSSLNYIRSEEVQWSVPGSLKIKVSDAGVLLPFYGDTTVIPLEQSDFEPANQFQTELRNNLEGMFAEPLLPEHFHITLHDLSNGPEEAPLKNQMESNAQKCREIFDNARNYFEKHPEYRTVKLHSTYVYNSCNISAVLGFAPASDRDYKLIMNLYNFFDDVVYLNYWLRMHLTLSYFTTKEFTKSEVHKMAKVMDDINNSRKISIELDLMKLAYQRFYSMNDYRTVFHVG